MKKFKEFKENLGFDIEEQTDKDHSITIGDVQVKLNVSRNNISGEDTIYLIPVIDDHRHSVSKGVGRRKYSDLWNATGVQSIILTLKEFKIPYKVDAVSHKSWHLYIPANLNLNLMAELYLKDKFNI